MIRRRHIESEAWENETIVTRAQVVRDADGARLEVSDCTVWSVDVFDMDEGGEPVFSVANQPPSTFVLSAFSLVAWDQDSTGYNCCAGLAAAAFERQGGHTMRVEYRIDTTVEGPVNVVHMVRLLPILHG